MEESENYKKLMEEIPLEIQLKVCEEAMDIQQTYIEELEKQLSLYGVGSSDSIKETVKNFADIDMFLNDINDEPFDKDSNSYGKVTRIANKYIIKLR